MSDLKRTLADLAERGTPIGADRLRDRVMLDLAPGLTDHSRLGCQTIPDGTVPVRVRIPGWNRNAAREEH